MPLLAMNGGVPLAKPAWPVWPQADERTRAAVLASVNSGRWAISGPYRGCQSFESKFSKAFSDYNGVPYCVLTSNGSSALVAALAALGVGPGDEVLVPGLTWVACATAPLRVGASPIFVDLTPGGLTMCPIAAADRLRSGAVKAIILVHQSCALADLSAFTALAKAFGVALIEDCSQAHGAKWRGMPVGTVGKVGVFSMQQTKLLTCGEGGAAITRDVGLYHRMMQYRADGRLTLDEPTLGRLELIEVDGIQGYNHCLSEIHSALLLDGIARLDDQNRRRERFAASLDRCLSGMPGITVPPRGDGDAQPAFYRYCFLVAEVSLRGHPAGIVADAIGQEVAAQFLAAPPPLPRHPLFRPWSAPALRKCGWDEWTPPPLPEAERIHRQAILIPHEYLLAPDDRAVDIAAAVEKVLDNLDELP